MKMNILHLRSSGGFYGAESVILNLCRELNDQSFTNHILGINHQKNSHAELVDKAQRMGIFANAVMCKGLVDMKTIKEIRFFILENNISILHCHDYKADFFGLLASRGLGIKRIATNHLWTKANLKLRCYEALDGIIYNFFDRIVGVSRPISKESQKFLFNKKKVQLIPNGIEVERFVGGNPEKVLQLKQALRIPENSFVIGNVARLSPEKDQKTLLKALKILKENNTGEEFPYYLLLIGHGQQEENLTRISADLGLAEYVRFLGVRSDIPDLYSVMDVYVLSSLREGLPMVLLEAMAAGVPVISTPAGGIGSVIQDGLNGFMVNFGDADGIARTIANIKNNEVNVMTVIDNAKELVNREYSSKVMAEKYRAVYEQVLKGG